MSEIDNIKQRCDLKVLTYLENLESRLSQLQAENEKLLECQKASKEISSEMSKDLSLAEAENARYREALEKIVDSKCSYGDKHSWDCNCDFNAEKVAKSALHPVGTEGGGK